jgi:hypothetical protein
MSAYESLRSLEVLSDGRFVEQAVRDCPAPEALPIFLQSPTPR